MTYSKMYLYHQIVFLSLVTVFCCLPLNNLTTFSHFNVYVVLLLFFGLGIPHGALDVSLGKSLLLPKFGSYWCLIFVLGYLCCVGVIIVCWIQLPFLSFLFFLAISAFHFGFSDRLPLKGWVGFLEGVGRGLLPIAIPAYFYPTLFQELVESSLSSGDALFLVKMINFFFYPDIILVALLILYGFWLKDKATIMNSVELASLLILFFILKPFAAFLIYFCFLHSFRHILSVLQEMNRQLNLSSVKWLILQALPATITTLIALAVCYLSIEHEVVDVPVMLNLFFISLAALTFPHMILVEVVKKT